MDETFRASASCPGVFVESGRIRVYDVIIVGGGPAGLNAALVLGRCRRSVLLCDAGEPRNAVSHRLGGFLSRDGEQPSELRRIGREQLQPYPNVEVRRAEVVDARRTEPTFQITLDDGRREQGRKLLLAPGLQNQLPEVEGFEEFWGRGVHNCPYCDGWENRDRAIVVYSRTPSAKGLGLELLAWSADVTLATDGEVDLSEEDRAALARNGVKLVEDPVRRLEGGACLERISLESGESIPCDALFFSQGPCLPSPLAERLGCDVSDKGIVETYSYEKTDVPGLYVAGDASRRVQFAIVAAAEGAMAAFAINTELLKEDHR